MKSTQYSEKVKEHFRAPRNVGSLEGEDVAVGRVGNPVCGDLMEMYIKVDKDVIKDIKFQTFGCASAIATSSMITEMAKGKTLEEAQQLTRQDVANELQGLPQIKMHCSNLAADALHDAIKNYREKQKPEVEKIEAEAPAKTEITGEQKFAGKGIYYQVKDLSLFKDKRVLLLDRGEASLNLAIELTAQTGRVIFLTPGKEISASADLKTRLKVSDVKMLYRSDLLETAGENELEKVLIADAVENEEYWLYVDAVIILQ